MKSTEFKRSNTPIKSLIRCSSKICFPEVRAAIRAADGYMDRITLTSAPMVPYYCPIHASWHIGHDRTRSDSYTRIYEKECLERERLGKEIGGLLKVLQGIDTAIAA